MKKTILVIALLCTAFMGKAQLAIGGAANVNYFFAGVGATPALGVLGEYGFKEGKFAAHLGFNFFFPKTQSSTTYADALNSGTSQTQISVPTTQKLNIKSLIIGAKMYFGDGSLTDGGLYVGAGVAVFLANVKTTYAAYDNVNYSIQNSGDGTNGSSSYTQVMITANFGYEKAFKFGNLFAEVQLYIPATNVNGQDVTEINIPASAGLAVGYKYVFGKK